MTSDEIQLLEEQLNKLRFKQDEADRKSRDERMAAELYQSCAIDLSILIDKLKAKKTP